MLVVYACSDYTGNKHAEIDTKSQVSKLTYDNKYKVAEEFINSYIKHLDDMTSNESTLEWTAKRIDVTDAFKSELKRVIEEANYNDPELGLGFDPILNAQDYPEKFAITETDAEYVIVNGVDNFNFKMVIKVKMRSGSWLVDGSGIINIPEEKRTLQ